MGYGNKTEKYRIGTPTLGETINPDDEKRSAQIIENQLFGSVRVHSGGHGVIRNGNWILVNSGSGDFEVILAESKSEGKPVFEGFINQIYTFTESTLRWGNLSNNTTYYLYVRLVEVDGGNSSRLDKKVQTDYNTTGTIPTDGVLVGIVIIDHPSNSYFIEDPVGRINIPSLGDHIQDNQNPHTPYLFQDDIVVSGLEILDFVRYNDLQLEQMTISGNSIISGNITVLGKLTVSGNVCVNGNVTYNQWVVTNLDVPGRLLVSELEVSSGIDFYASPLFRKDVILASGIRVDGFDPSVGIPLIDGSNADDLHGHIFGSLAESVKPIHHSVRFPNTVVSGTTSGSDRTFLETRIYNSNFYEWFADTKGNAAIPITRIILPDDFESLDRVNITHGVGSTVSGSNITVTAQDKDNTELVMTNNFLQSTQITTSEVSISGGQLLPGKVLTLKNRMDGTSGIGVYLGDMTVWYVPRHGEKIVFTWEKDGSVTAAEQNFDSLRVAPCDLRTEKVLCSQTIGLSGSSFFGINAGNEGSTPSNFLTTKPTLNFTAVGKSYQTSEVPINAIITGGQLLSATIDQIASGSRDVSVQLVTHRM